MRVISNNPNLETSRTRLEELEARLHHGDRLIQQMEADNQPVDHLVQHWITLLHEYEAEFKSLQSAA